MRADRAVETHERIGERRLDRRFRHGPRRRENVRRCLETKYLDDLLAAMPRHLEYVSIDALYEQPVTESEPRRIAPDGE